MWAMSYIDIYDSLLENVRIVKSIRNTGPSLWKNLLKATLQPGTSVAYRVYGELPPPPVLRFDRNVVMLFNAWISCIKTHLPHTAPIYSKLITQKQTECNLILKPGLFYMTKVLPLISCPEGHLHNVCAILGDI